MVDVVVNREDAPSVVLTLDKDLASEQTLELLHTSQFTVIGKVTQTWPADDDIVNLYRRSVMSLVPVVGQAVTWNMIGLLASIAAGVDAREAEQSARAAAGIREGEQTATSDEDAHSDNEDDVIFSFDVEALVPVVRGPAVQVLPLAICT
jgi:hypothetical protein